SSRCSSSSMCSSTSSWTWSTACSTRGSVMSRPDAHAEHYVAPVDTAAVPVDVVRIDAKRSNLWLDAWRDLRHRPLFWISSAFVLLVIVVSLWPGLFTTVAPNNGCSLGNSNGGPEAGHP